MRLFKGQTYYFTPVEELSLTDGIGIKQTLRDVVISSYSVFSIDMITPFKRSYMTTPLLIHYVSLHFMT